MKPQLRIVGGYAVPTSVGAVRSVDRQVIGGLTKEKGKIYRVKMVSMAFGFGAAGAGYAYRFNGQLLRHDVEFNPAPTGQLGTPSVLNANARRGVDDVFFSKTFLDSDSYGSVAGAGGRNFQNDTIVYPDGHEPIVLGTPWIAGYLFVTTDSVGGRVWSVAFVADIYYYVEKVSSKIYEKLELAYER